MIAADEKALGRNSNSLLSEVREAEESVHWEQRIDFDFVRVSRSELVEEERLLHLRLLRSYGPVDVELRTKRNLVVETLVIGKLR